MIITNRHSPDTCDCVYEYTWDNEIPEEKRIHTVSVFATKCKAHTDLSDEDAYNQILSENQTKNLIVQGILDLSNVEVNWDFDEDRNLVINSSVPIVIPDISKDISSNTLVTTETPDNVDIPPNLDASNDQILKQ